MYFWQKLSRALVCVDATFDGQKQFGRPSHLIHQRAIEASDETDRIGAGDIQRGFARLPGAVDKDGPGVRECALDLALDEPTKHVLQGIQAIWSRLIVI